MKKKIAILGSTGSIGKTLIDILKKDKKNFEIVLLSANKNIQELEKQANLFKVKNLIVTDKKNYLKIKSLRKLKKKKIFNDFSSIDKILKDCQVILKQAKFNENEILDIANTKISK